MQKRYGWLTRLPAGMAATMLVMVAQPAVVAHAADEPAAGEPTAVEVAPAVEVVAEHEPADDPAPESPPAPETLPEPESPPVSEETPAPDPERSASPTEDESPEEQSPSTSDDDPPASSPEDDERPAPAPEEEEEETPPADEDEEPPAPSPEDDDPPAPSPEDDDPAPSPDDDPPAPTPDTSSPAPDDEPTPDDSNPTPDDSNPTPDDSSPGTSPSPEQPSDSDAPSSGAPSSNAPAPASPAPLGSGSSGGYEIWDGSRGEALSTEWLGFLALSGMEPTEYALEDIPAEMLDLYQAATLVCPGLPWPVLAGVGKIETDHGRNVAVSSAGARGPMQFLPSTWEQSGIDGNGDGLALINDPADAVYSAAGYLCDHGGGEPETLDEALYAYNHAWWYVEDVLHHADRYSTWTRDGAEPGEPVDREALLTNPRLVVYPGGRADVALGQVDPRVLDLLALLTQQHEVTVVAVRTGHTKYVAGTNRVSNHYHGRAVDIAAIDGEPVGSDSPRARAFVLWLASLDGPRRPTEVGSPFADLQDQPGHFSNAAHMGHVHVGWGAGPQE